MEHEELALKRARDKARSEFDKAIGQLDGAKKLKRQRIARVSARKMAWLKESFELKRSEYHRAVKALEEYRNASE